MPRLIVNAGTPQAIEFVLKPGANYVGRGFANDLKLDDASVSGSHAQFILNGKEVTVKDLNSTNGTFINRQRITEAILIPGQYVRLGGIELLLHSDGETEITARAQRTQVPVSAPIIGEFRIAGTPLVSGRTGDTAPPFPARIGDTAPPFAQPPAAAPVAVATPPSPIVAAAATPAAESPIKGLRMTSAAAAPVAEPAPTVAIPMPAPAPIRIPVPRPVQAHPASSPAAAPAAAPIARAVATPVAQDPAPAEGPPVPPSGAHMVEAPAGKNTCKYHPNNPGHFLCQTCGNVFCSLCVAARRAGEATGYFCRSCGTQCVPVKVRFTPKKETGPKHYSDVTVLVRAVGFGCAGALVAAGVWAGLGAAIGAVASFMPGILCWVTGVICGFGVKIGCQDRPGIIFSMIAIGTMMLGIALGETAVAFITHFRIVVGIYGIVGLMAGGFSAWRIGGGDF